MREERVRGANASGWRLVFPGFHLAVCAMDGKRSRGADALSSSGCLAGARPYASCAFRKHRTVRADGAWSAAASGAAYRVAVADHDIFPGPRGFAAWRSGAIRILSTGYDLGTPCGGIATRHRWPARGIGRSRRIAAAGADQGLDPGGHRIDPRRASRLAHAGTAAPSSIGLRVRSRLSVNSRETSSRGPIADRPG